MMFDMACTGCTYTVPQVRRTPRQGDSENDKRYIEGTWHRAPG
jgi:hypothetical protein